MRSLESSTFVEFCLEIIDRTLRELHCRYCFVPLNEDNESQVFPGYCMAEEDMLYDAVSRDN